MVSGELTPNNINALSIIQEGEMYILEDAEFRDTKVGLDEENIRKYVKWQNHQKEKSEKDQNPQTSFFDEK